MPGYVSKHSYSGTSTANVSSWKHPTSHTCTHREGNSEHMTDKCQQTARAVSRGGGPSEGGGGGRELGGGVGLLV